MLQVAHTTKGLLRPVAEANKFMLLPADTRHDEVMN